MRKLVNDFSMNYDDQGAGIPTLLIHGYPLNHNMWKPQFGGLADIARVIAPDLRGHGESEAAPSPAGDPDAYSMDLHAGDCAAMLDALEIREPIVLAGSSMGGYIAFEFLRRYPERVAGLILAATRAGVDSPEARLNRMKAVELVGRSGVGAIAESMLPLLLSPQSYDTSLELVKSVNSIMEATSLSGIVGDQLGMRDRQDSIPMLPDIDIPTLLVHGADDQIINIEGMEAMKTEIPSSILKVIPDAGHIVNLEQPKTFNKAVREFILKLQ